MRKRHMWAKHMMEQRCLRCYWSRRAKMGKEGDATSTWEYLWRKGNTVTTWTTKRRVPPCGQRVEDSEAA